MDALEFRPSNLDRRLACLGSAQAESGLVDTGSIYADEGTAAHEVGAKCLEENIDAKACIGQKFYKGIICDAEMANAVQEYIDTVRENPGHLMVECKLDLSPWIEEGEGTSDAVNIAGKTLYVGDLKYGQGVQVDAKDNPQLMMYALGTLHTYSHLLDDIENVHLTIYQPRKHHISDAQYTVEELMAFGETVKEATKLAREANAPKTPGKKQCQFCKAKHVCRDLAEYNVKLMQGKFDDLTKPLEPQPVDDLDLATVAKILKEVDLITGWVKALETRAMQNAMAGIEVPGFKVVDGRGSRNWVNDEEPIHLFKKKRVKIDDFMPRKLLSVAQAEKLIGKKKFFEIYDPLVTKVKGRPQLAPVEDKRPAIVVEETFSDIT